MTNCPFPIGYGGFFQTDPNTIYAGTKWEQKKDVFILAAGDKYAAGSTGGEAQHVLNLAELPSTVWHTSDKFAGGIHTSYSPAINGNGICALQEEMGRAHNNMPPYLAMPFWVRTA